MNDLHFSKGICHICQKKDWVAWETPQTSTCQQCLENKIRARGYDPENIEMVNSEGKKVDFTSDFKAKIKGEKTSKMEKILFCSNCEEVMSNKGFENEEKNEVQQLLFNSTKLKEEVNAICEKNNSSITHLHIYSCQHQKVVWTQAENVRSLFCLNCQTSMKSVDPQPEKLNKSQTKLITNPIIVRSRMEQGTVASFVLCQWECNCFGNQVITVED